MDYLMNISQSLSVLRNRSICYIKLSFAVHSTRMLKVSSVCVCVCVGGGGGGGGGGKQAKYFVSISCEASDEWNEYR